MAINKIEIQSATGDIYYPHTSSDIVKHGNSTLSAFLTLLENKFKSYLPLTGGTLTGDLKIAKSNAQLTLNGKDTNYYQIAHSSANGTLVFNYNGKSLFTVQNNGNIIPIINKDMSIGDYNFKLKSIASEDFSTSAAKIITTTQPNTIQVQGLKDSGMGAIKLGTGGCRIYGTSSAERLYVEGGIYTNLLIECGNQIIANGSVYPGRNAQGGWDCGLADRRFYTVYCVNVNQSSDRSMKEDIQYLDEKDNSKLKMISSKEDTPFRDFLKDELRLASYKYKRQQTIEAEDGTETIKTLPHKEEDSQLGFIAQDIKNTEIGSMFVYGEDGNMSYSPTGFTTVVAKALQEEIKFRDKQIESLEITNNKLIETLDKINEDEIIKKLDIDKYTLDDIISSLKQPERDLRDKYPQPVLRSDILHIEDLKKGEKLQGTVRNVVDFGLFIDIGLKNDGLAHISKLCNEYLRHPSEKFSVGDIVDCYVDSIDLEHKKVGLSLIEV